MNIALTTLLADALQVEKALPPKSAALIDGGEMPAPMEETVTAERQASAVILTGHLELERLADELRQKRNRWIRGAKRHETAAQELCDLLRDHANK